MTSFETKLPLTDEQLKQIGRITANFSFLEFVLSFCICGLINDDQRVGQIITSQMSFQNLVHLLGSLFKHRGFDAEKITAFDKLLGEAMQIEQRRNEITHSIWATHQDEGKSSRVKITARFKKGFEMQWEPMGVDELKQIADSITNVAHKIQYFTIETMTNISFENEKPQK